MLGAVLPPPFSAAGVKRTVRVRRPLTWLRLRPRVERRCCGVFVALGDWVEEGIGWVCGDRRRGGVLVVVVVVGFGIWGFGARVRE